MKFNISSFVIAALIFSGMSLQAQDASSTYKPDEDHISYFDHGNSLQYVSYYEDGTIFEKGNFADNVRHGEFKQFFSNGQLKIKGQYSNGLRTGLWHFFDSDGTEVKAVYDGKGQLVQAIEMDTKQ